LLPTKTSPEQNRQLRTSAVAQLLGVTRDTVLNWLRSRPDFPRPSQAGSNGRPYFWSEAAVRAWLARQGQEAARATA
jgi:predicted DNA-binding transcriptional regulator AlpA